MADVSEDFKCVRLKITGRVQGVWYRGWTQDNALALNLKGWVRNRRDGSVEAMFSGSIKDVDDMIARCRQGPRFADVRSIEIAIEEELPPPGFEILASG